MKVTSLRYLDAKFHHPSPKIKEIPKNTNGLQQRDYPPAHRLNVNVLLSNITFFVIFAVLDVSFAVNSCLNRSFLHLYLQFYYISVAVNWYKVGIF